MLHHVQSVGNFYFTQMNHLLGQISTAQDHSEKARYEKKLADLTDLASQKVLADARIAESEAMKARADAEARKAEAEAEARKAEAEAEARKAEAEAEARKAEAEARKAEADAEARKAEADSEARKAEADVRKAEVESAITVARDLSLVCDEYFTELGRKTEADAAKLQFLAEKKAGLQSSLNILSKTPNTELKVK
jgi:membrane protein involved in colicin uptake